MNIYKKITKTRYNDKSASKFDKINFLTIIVIWFYLISYTMVTAAPWTPASSVNTSQNQITQAPEKKIYIDLKSWRTVDSTYVTIDDLQNGKYVETFGEQKIFVDMTKEFSYKDNAISITPIQWAISMTAVQYEQYIKSFQSLEKQYRNTQWLDKEQILLDATKTIVDNKVDFPQWAMINNDQRLKLSILIWVVGKNELKWLSNTLVQPWGNLNVSNINPNIVTTSQSISTQQSQIDALKALLDWTTNVWVSSLSTSTLASVWVGKTNTLNADGSKTLSLSVKYKPWTLNPINAYKNRKLNDMAELLNNPQSQIQVIESIMKFTRMRRGGRIGKFVKKAIWKKELSTLSNEVLRKEFNEKMNLFVESRLTHLKKDPNSPEAQFAQKIENNIRLAFDQFIAKRIVADMNTVLNNNPQQAKVIQMSPTQGSNAIAA